MLDADSSVSPRSVPPAKPLHQSQPIALPAQGFKSNGVSAFEVLLLVLSSQLPSVLTSGSLSAALARVIPQAGAQDLGGRASGPVSTLPHHCRSCC